MGDTVLVTNRSIREGGSGYVFASTTRLRNFVQSVFHETAEHEIRGAGQRTGGPLESCAGLMNVFLSRLKSEGWIKEGRVVVEHASLTVNINVTFVPVEPTDSILIQWSDSH